MPSRETTLEAAAFLDSATARTLAGLSQDEIRTVVQRFLDCCYDDLGKAPRHLDGEDLHGVLAHRLPSRYARRDPLEPKTIPVLRAYLDFLEERAIVSQSYELRRALEESAAPFRQAVETGETHRHDAPAQKPIVNRASKVGRNDPCPCGSGRKFKQCCAKLGA